MGKLFVVPTEALALAVATEWNGQKDVIKRHSMHLVGDLHEHVLHLLTLISCCSLIRVLRAYFAPTYLVSVTVFFRPHSATQPSTIQRIAVVSASSKVSLTSSKLTPSCEKNLFFHVHGSKRWWCHAWHCIIALHRYQLNEPEELYNLQQERWMPLIDYTNVKWVRSRWGWLPFVDVCVTSRVATRTMLMKRDVLKVRSAAHTHNRHRRTRHLEWR